MLVTSITNAQVRVGKHLSNPTETREQPLPPQSAPLSDSVDHGSSAGRNGVFSPSLRLQHLAHKRIEYPAFRETFFFDESVNPVLKSEGWESEPMSMARESRKLWSSSGRSISSRLPKTAVPPGSAFRNECTSPDRLYSSSRGSLGYEVNRSLRGSSLCNTTKRFDSKAATPESVGPGSYNVLARSRPVLHFHSPESSDSHVERLKEWGNAPADLRQMDSVGEWKLTSERPLPTNYSFRRAPQPTWIEQVEERQRRFSPHARAPATLKSSAEQRMPDFLQGVRNPVHTKHSALAAMAYEAPSKGTTRRHTRLPSHAVTDPAESDSLTEVVSLHSPRRENES